MKLRISIAVLTVLVIASLTCVPAQADLIWEPNDSFYEQKREDCVYNNRSYTANGKDGAVAILKEPESEETVATIHNGNEFYVSFVYTDKQGAEWGVVEFNPDGSGNLAETDYSKAISGWVRMADMTVIYDYISFAEDHQDEFKPYTGNYDEFKTSSTLVFWRYPGSGVIVSQVDEFEIGDYFSMTHTYTDAESKLWGFVEYFYGHRNVWICISNPSGAGIETAQTPAPSNVAVSPSAEMPAVQSNQTPMLLFIVVIVAAVVIITGVLIAVFWKKNAKTNGVTK